MSTQSLPARLAEGTPGGGRFTFGRFTEPDMSFGKDGVAVDVCPKCDGPSDQAEGIPCSTCLDNTCACGAGLDDGEGYDGRCGSCADRAHEAEANSEGEAAAARAADLMDQAEPIDGSEEWHDEIESTVGREIRSQCPDAVGWNYVIDDGDSTSYDSMVHVTLADGSNTYVDLAGTQAADAIAELSSYDSDFGTMDTYENHDLTAGGESACPECHRTGQHKIGCTSGRQVVDPIPAAGPAQEPQRLHTSMGDGPIVTSPSGEYGFYLPVNGWEKPEGLAKHGPIVAVAQLVNGGRAWSPTPARLYADSVTDLAPGSKLAIDLGASWALSEADTAAFAEYGRQAASAAARAPMPEVPAPVLPATDDDKKIAAGIYSQIGPVVAGNMDAKARNTFAITSGVRMTSCRAGARKRVDVIVTLNGDDLYDIEVVTTPTLKADSKPIAKTSGVHVAQLQGLMLRIGDGNPEAINQAR